MSPWLRRLLIAAVAVLALLIAAAAWFIASFDADRYKGLLIERVQTQYGRTLAIDGPIGLSVFPRIEVTLRDIRLSEARRSDEFMTLKQANLAVQLLPLLRRELTVDRIAAQGVHLVYTRDAQGRRNIDDLLSPPGEPNEAGTEGQALRFEVSAIEFGDLQATVRDAMAGIDGRFTVEQFNSGRLADGAEAPISLRAHATLQQPAIDAALAANGRLRLTLPPNAPARLELHDLTLTLQGTGLGVQHLDATLTAAALRQDGAALAAEGLTLTLSGERLGLTLKDSRLALKALALDAAQRRLQLDALELQLKGTHGEQALQAQLVWPQLDIEGDALKGSALKGDARIGNDEQALQLGFASQAPSGSFDRVQLPGLSLDIRRGAGHQQLRGELRGTVTLTRTPVSANFESLTAKLTLNQPGVPPTTLTMQGRAQASPAAASWQLEGRANDQPFSSSGEASLGGAVPRVDAQARFATLDLTRFVAAPAGAARGEAPPSTPSGDAAIDLSGLKALDGRLRLRADTLHYPPYRVAEATLDATLTGGTLRVNQLAGRAWGGRFTAQASAQTAPKPTDQRVTLRLEASDVDVAALLKDVAQMSKLEGKGRVQADLRSSGASVEDWRRQLAGQAALQLRDGAVRGINLAKALRQWRNATTANKDAVQSANAQEKTDFSEISASFLVADGVARNRDLIAKSPFLRVDGEGAIDLGQNRIDYLARATVTTTPEGQDGAELAALKGITVPVKLSGPFEAVDYRVQWEAVAGELLKKRAVDAIGGKAGRLLQRLTPAAPAASAPEGTASAPPPAPNPKDRLLRQLFGR